MTDKDYEQRILEALNPAAETDHDRRVREALDGTDFFFGLPEIEADYDSTVRVWTARESLKASADRYARAAAPKGQARLTDAQLTQVVQETFNLTNEGWSDITRVERVSAILESHASRFEKLR